MTFKAKVASALSFAHLAGLGRSKAAASAEDEDDQKKKDDAKAKAKAKAEDDEPDEDDKKKDDADARAEDDEPDAEDDEPEKKDDDDKKSAKAKAKADDGDDEDDEKAKAGAKRERARCAAIFGSPAAAKNVALAAELAFNTDLSASQAVAVLSKAPAAAATNANRAAGNPRIGSGGGTEATGKQAIDSRWDRAFSAVTPQRRK